MKQPAQLRPIVAPEMTQAIVAFAVQVRVGWNEEDQPTARPGSLITGKPIDIKSGPNWDDDLSGTPDYARHDPNLKNLSPAEQEAMFQLERMAFYYLPRICNHCLNPACVASCPSGAIYKRGEDGVVLINQKVCRAWRMW